MEPGPGRLSPPEEKLRGPGEGGLARQPCTDGEESLENARWVDGKELEKEDDEDDDFHEELDPRIQEELEQLNQASEQINKLELQLDEARTAYRKILAESARKLNAQASQLGNCIEKARPYYESRRLAKEAQQETQKAALRYERAVSMHNAAREMVFVAEQGLMADKNRLDPTWQEMLNHATSKVNEAEEERLRSEREHQRVTQVCQKAEAKVQQLQVSLKRQIIKSKPYFEMKAQFNQILDEHSIKVTELERHVSQAKMKYSVALRNLEQISEQIHARRLQRLVSRRSSPVGAEAAICSMDLCHSVSAATLGADGPASDNISVLSLLTIASDLQKFDSIDHLADLSDVSSLNNDDGSSSGSIRRDSSFFKHHRSVSL
ncbi:SH3 domain-binding protein 5-like isoform X1 [Protopterus annectens]|uniref:SH3 domain-binding protein 5-like isoform X1 n=1 Tax=Protopterus annectens TaxID=7888 RepID=UPI001CF959FD|nr:SH3 domain-binding protein 5-like isoform X1 [Protopterus annectens]